MNDPGQSEETGEERCGVVRLASFGSPVTWGSAFFQLHEKQVSAFLLSGLIIVLQRETCLPSRNSFLSVITDFSFFLGDQEECRGIWEGK